MKVKPPSHRRKFANEWDEIRYLRDKLLYWLYQRGDAVRARPYAERLECLLREADPDNNSILGQECLSLVYEAKGNLQKAIEHRTKEIDLIQRMYNITQDVPHRDFLLKDYGYGDLSDRLDLLATLYHDVGQLDRALETIWQSKELCGSHGIRFDGQDLLLEYSREAQFQAKSDLNQLWERVSPYHRVRDAWQVPCPQMDLNGDCNEATEAFSACSRRQNRAIKVLYRPEKLADPEPPCRVEIVGGKVTEPQSVRVLVVTLFLSPSMLQKVFSLAEDWVVTGEVRRYYEEPMHGELFSLIAVPYSGVSSVV